VHGLTFLQAGGHLTPTSYSSAISRLSHNSKSKIYYDRWSVGQSLLVSSTHLVLKTRFLFLSDRCKFLMWDALSDERMGLSFTISCWPFPAQSFSGPSPSGLMTIFYCLRFESPGNWRAISPCLYPPGTGWPSYTTRHWVPFSLPHMNGSWLSLYSLGTDHTENTSCNI
jgi:hypothetical protein